MSNTRINELVKIGTYLENICVYSDIQWGESLFIFAEKGWMLEEQVPEAVLVAILWAEVAWSVSIDIFRVDVGANHQHRLDNSEVAPDTCDMKWSPEVPGPCVDLASVLNEQLN